MIPRELLAALRTIEIHTARLANENLSGTYASSFKGQGLAFREVRPYQPGDDVRSIDWNVSARMNEAFVKVFVEEREMTVMLVVDLSPSQRFGTRRAPKTRVASEVAALLAFSAIRNNDRVGLILATDRVERIVPPKKGEKHVMRVVREILGYEPRAAADRPAPSGAKATDRGAKGDATTRGAAARTKGGAKTKRRGEAGEAESRRKRGARESEAPFGGAKAARGAPPHDAEAPPLGAATDLKAALEALVGVSRRRSIAFVVSDFFAEGYERSLALASAKHDVIPVVLVDPRDLELPDVGLATFEDFETGDAILVDTSDRRVRAAHAGAMKQLAAARQQLFAKLGVDSVEVTTHGSFVKPLRDLFARRARRVRTR